MTEPNLLRFRYHPDPIGTGSLIASPASCIACGRARGYIYVGPVYSEQDLDDSLCPWCIFDGIAHEKLGVEFVDALAVGGYGVWEKVGTDVVNEVAFRTPGFNGWQQERWFTHCGDAGEFIALAGLEQLEHFGLVAVNAIAEECGYFGKELAEYLRLLDRDAGPTAYLFRCRHCGAYGGYSDCH